MLAWAGCAGDGNYRLQLVFPDEESRNETAAIDIWALAPGAYACDDLIAGSVRPEDLDQLAHLQMDYPPASEPALQRVPAGDTVFLAEGTTSAGARILRGCAQVHVGAGETVHVTLELVRVCDPDPAGEQLGNGIDDDCDGLTDECSRNEDCADASPCTADLCVADACEHSNYPDGLGCDDQNPCTGGDECRSGSCVGETKDCSHVGGICVEGACDPATGECIAVPADEGEACDDLLYCTDPDACSAGSCTGTPRDCDDQVACTLDTCNEGEGTCTHVLEPRPGAEGPPGDATCANQLDDDCDGLTDSADPNCLICSLDSECDDSNACTVDACVAGACTNVALGDGSSCDDGLYCTTGDVCAGGACAGQPRDCSSVADGCNTGVCLEIEDRCDPRPVADQTPCNDGQYCTEGERCASGQCTGGQPRDCSDGNVCTADSCDEAADRCNHPFQPIPGAEGPDGDPTCSDGEDNDCDGFIDDLDSSCHACQGPGDCDDSNPCTADSCEGGECRNDLVLDGTACDDGLFCTDDDVCTGGNCSGPDLDCDEGDPCTADSCDETADSCDHVLQPLPGGEGPPRDPSCYDGEDNDCDGLTDLADDDCRECEVAGECDDGNQCTTDECVDNLCRNTNVPDGSGCQDNLYCTVGDACANGNCSGVPRDCSDSADQCNNGVCMESLDQCVAQPLANGTQCDDDLFCTISDECDQGVCQGSARDCTAAGDQCNDGVCFEGQDSCGPQPKANGTPCDDALFCTVGEHCVNGDCLGSNPPDCSFLADECNQGVCNPGSDQCEAAPLTDGTPCNTASYCILGSSCQSGSCEPGTLRDCSGLSDPCHLGVCDEDQDTCVAMPICDGQIAAGQSHTCALKIDGTVVCWGANSQGQLGDGTTSARYRPTPVVGVGGTGILTDVIQISGGLGGETEMCGPSARVDHTCAARSDGTVVCWGNNRSGQLGNGTTTASTVPVEVLGVGGSGLLTDVSAVSTGGRHTCARKDDGTVFCWGAGTSGQLGTGVLASSNTPVQVHGIGDVGFLTGIDQVSAGFNHTCALTSDETALCWGSNWWGALGDNTTQYKTTPVQVVGVGGAGFLADIARVSAGYLYSCAQDNLGHLTCWGINQSGMLGDGTTTDSLVPVQVHGVGDVGLLGNVSEFATSRGYLWDTDCIDYDLVLASTCASRADGSAVCWGFNGEGNLGDTTTATRLTPVQVHGVGDVGFLSGVIQIAPGFTHTCALVEGGSVFCWGDNFWGMLGNDTTGDSLTPVQVVDESGAGYLDLSP